MTIKVDQANPELEFRTPAPNPQPPAPSPQPPIPDHPHAHHPPRSPPAHHRTPRDLPRRDGRPDAPGHARRSVAGDDRSDLRRPAGEEGDDRRNRRRGEDRSEEHTLNSSH